MALDPLARPQSVFELQSALANYQPQAEVTLLTISRADNLTLFP